MSGLDIRPAGVNDAAELGRIHALAWRAAYRGIATDAFLDGFTPEKRGAFFARILPGTVNEHYLLYMAGVAVGMLAIGPVQEETEATHGCGEVHALYLLPEGIGRGIGAGALQFAVERLRALGFGDIVLTVLSENARARAFYERFGFAPDSAEEPFDMGRPVMELRYRLKA